MPFNPQALLELRKKIKGGRKDFAKALNECAIRHGIESYVPVGEDTLTRYSRGRSIPRADYIDALEYLTQDNGVQGLEFYTSPRRKNNIASC